MEGRAGRGLRAVGFDFQDSRQREKLRLMLLGVMLAEQQFGTGGKLGPNLCGSPAAIAAVGPS